MAIKVILLKNLNTNTAKLITKTFFKFFVFSLLSILLLSFGLKANSQTTSYTLSGVVSGGNAPLVGASVYVTNSTTLASIGSVSYTHLTLPTNREV